jgi:hypothetical protein
MIVSGSDSRHGDMHGLTKTVDQESQDTRTSRIIHVRVLANLRSHDFRDPGGGVEQVGEPAHESTNLHITDSSNGFRKVNDGFVDSMPDVGEFSGNTFG